MVNMTTIEWNFWTKSRCMNVLSLDAIQEKSNKEPVYGVQVYVHPNVKISLYLSLRNLSAKTTFFQAMTKSTKYEKNFSHNKKKQNTKNRKWVNIYNNGRFVYLSMIPQCIRLERFCRQNANLLLFFG